MEHTQGRGGRAEVWVDDALLTVCDGVSDAQQPCPPGELADVRFRYVTEAPVPLAETIGENPRRRKALEPAGNWAYIALGQVVSLMPVVIDFGLMRMEDAGWATDESLIGKFVRIHIDRLEIERRPADREAP